jgi:large subunit ribosomal protein L30
VAGKKYLKITQTKSKIGKNKKAKRTIEALGLKRIGHTVIHEDTPQIRGMIRVVYYMVDVQELDEEQLAQEGE